MMDIGWPEFLVLAGLAVVIFGPDKLPKVAADAGRMIRRLRTLANSARTDLTDAAGVDVRGIADDLRSVADLHPKRLLGSAVADLADLTDLTDSKRDAPTRREPAGTSSASAQARPAPASPQDGSADRLSGQALDSSARAPGHDPDAT